MGVRGLTTYIAERSDLYLLSYKLQNTYVVIDGNSIASQLYKKFTRSDSVFGGDYDEYYQVVTDFFKSLQKCNITPIVIFDGGYEKKKLKTVYTRNVTKLVILKNNIQSFSKFKFFPMFMKQTFWDVMENMGIMYAQCDFEADNEIAAIARQLKCPVLSYDSDFYIYDVLYIPFSSVKLDPVKNDIDKSYYIDCLIYDVDKFLKEFEGLDKSLLPLAATLLGNDYIESKICNQLFNHVIMPKKKSMTLTQRKIHGVLHWLKKETIESAVKLILSHVKKQDGKAVVQAIYKSIHDYTTSPKTLSLFFKMTEISNADGMDDMNYNEKENYKLKKLPSYLMDLFHECKVLPFILDMVTLHAYYSPLQIEDMEEPSAHLLSFPIIRTIYTILSAYINQNKELKIYLKVKGRFSAVYLDVLPDNISANIFGASKEVKLGLIYEVLNISEDDVSVLNNFDEKWKLFLLALIHWAKSLKRTILTSQIQAILFCAIANQIAQSKVGYFYTTKSFTSMKGMLLSKLEKEKNESNVNPDEIEINFTTLIANVTELDCLKLTQKLILLRRTTDEARNNFLVSKIHSFNCFQSLLYHLMQLNAILFFPFNQIKIHDFYSGTLIYNMFLCCKKKPNSIEQLLSDVPSIQVIYNFLIDKLIDYFPINPKNVKKKSKKKKKKNVVVSKNVSETSDDSEECDQDNDNYNDEDNPYFFLLQKNVS